MPTSTPRALAANAQPPFPLGRWIDLRHRPRHRYLHAALGVAAATALCFPLFALFDLANLVMVHLLAIVWIAIRLGRGPAIAATVGGVAAFVFFFVPDYHSFVLADLAYLPTTVTMLVVSLLLSALTSQLRAAAIATEARELRSDALYELSRDLAAADDRAAVAAIAARHGQRAFGAALAIWPAEAADDAAAAVPEPWRDAARAALRTRTAQQAAGAVLQPLVVAGTAIGTLSMAGHRTVIASAEDLQLLESFANNLAVALHRIVAHDAARDADRRAEQERLRNVMLSSVSHDLRTPLASITGAITTLIDSADQLDPATRLDLMQSVREDADALERQVRNLLDLTRLESGSLVPRCEWHSLEEVVGCAMRRVEPVLGMRPVAIDTAAAPPLVWFDGSLVEQLLVNLLENAARYTPAGSRIDLRAAAAGADLLLHVIDQGPGIPVAEREQVFDKFRRGSTARSQGAGLGLAICRAIAQLHGGAIAVADGPAGGADFAVRLPQPAAPPTALPEPPSAP